jgi:hypothetical protein
MSETNGPSLRRKLTQTLAAWKRSASREWTKLQELPWGELLFYGAMLSVLVWLLTGCAQLSTPPSEPPRNPQKPLPELSQPTEPYLNRVQRNIELWEKRLRDTLRTP